MHAEPARTADRANAVEEIVMPTYTYRCTDCDHDFTLFHGMLETGDRECPLCGGVAKRRMGTGAGLIFKGSGFYETDYKRKNGANGSVSSTSTHGSTSSSTTDSTAKASDSAATSTADKPDGKVAEATA